MPSIAPPDTHTLATVSETVAAAVALREGPGGVVDVIRHVARNEPVSVGELSRLSQLPVPLVAAICGELRTRGVLSKTRPVELTHRGKQIAAPLLALRQLDCRCSACSGRGIVVPAGLDAITERLAQYAAEAPSADMTLDQAHCTVETKLKRALILSQAGRLTSGPLMFLGDDDLISVAVVLISKHLGLSELMSRLVVFDVDARIVEFLGGVFDDLDVTATMRTYDAREDLPADLIGTCTTVVTDPPYTVEGASLFLSRAVDALSPDSRGEILLSFGAKSPADTLELQGRIGSMGLMARSILQNFNEYDGAGTLGGVSNLYELVTARKPNSLVHGTFVEPIYTAKPNRVRTYRCQSCEQEFDVGPGGTFNTIADLKAVGCSQCGASRFRPLALRPVKR